ncbi:MAG TPA: IPT/TIG domain-containing protein, partial [Saprospiraceae bacterium]
MPHKLSPRQTIALPTHFFCFLIISLFQTGKTSAQCMMVPLSMDHQAANSHLIVEGVVKEKNAFITAAGNFIYTTYQIEVTKIFKGELEKSTLYIVESGGQVGSRRIEVSPCISLQVEESGTFFLERFTFKDPQDGLRYSETVYRAYASSQSILSYDFNSNRVIGHFDQFELDAWYDVLTNVTGAGYKQVKELSLPVKPRSSMVPTITSMSPLTITSGSFSVLTINGSGFGAVQGTSTVEFKNPDDGGGTWAVASSAHTVLWTNTQIQIKVPYKAGSGQVRVTVSAMSATSSQSLAIGYSQYNIEYNVPPLTLFKVQLRNMSGIGGYTFRYHTELNSNVPARKSFERALNSWRCNTEVNFIVGDVTAVDVMLQDGINVVRFDNGAEIPAGVGAQTLSYFDDCLSLIPPTIDIVEIDLVFNDAISGVTWEYGPDLPTGTEIDFESIALHELGHANCLGHVISAPEVLHYSIGPGEHKRILSANDIAGGAYVHAQSTSNPANCGNNVMVDYRQVKYVDVGTTSIQTGDTWAQAYKYLQDALAVTTACVDTIYVAAGTYYPDEGTGLTNNNQLLRFTLNTPVVVMGGYNSATGVRNLSSNISILSGDIEQDVTTDPDNSQNVVRVSSTSTLDGFSIERGYADAASGEGRDGAGVYVST